MPKHLKVRAKLSKDNKKVSVTILEQTHAGKYFGKTKHPEQYRRAEEYSSFTFGRVVLKSSEYQLPRCNWSDYHGGKRATLDIYFKNSFNVMCKTIQMSAIQFELFREAVKAYNEWGATQ